MTTLDFTLLAMLSGFFGGQFPYIMRRWAQKTEAERRCRHIDSEKTPGGMFDSSAGFPSFRVVGGSDAEPPEAA